MARVAFLKDKLELCVETVPGSFAIGDPLPVPLIQDAMTSWKDRYGYDNDAHVKPGVWDEVRVGAQTFSAAKYLQAEKDWAANKRVQPDPVKLDNTPVKLAAPDNVPSWDIVDDGIKPGFSAGAKGTTAIGQGVEPHSFKITPDGEIDYQATQDRDLAAALKLGAKPRTFKGPDQ